MAAELLRTTTTPAEATAVIAICFGLFIFASLSAVASGFPVASDSFSSDSLLWLAATELFLGAVALSFLAKRKYWVASLIPRPTAIGTASAVALFFGTWLASWILVAPFAAGQPSQPIGAMIAAATPSLGVVVPMAIVNGTFEEVFLLGFLLRGLRAHGFSVALGTSVLVRVLYHLYQGPLGAVSVLAVGLTFGLYYIRFGQLWPPVLAHIVLDIVPFLSGET